MRAVCWHGAEDVRVDTVPDPTILNPRDAIIKVTSTAICGSDLHLYDGYIPSMQSGDILGHEFMGEVVETGPGVKNLQQGDRVVIPSPFPVAVASFATATCGLCATIPTLTRGWLKSFGAIPRLDCSVTLTCWVGTQAVRLSMFAFLLPTLARLRYLRDSAMIRCCS